MYCSQNKGFIKMHIEAIGVIGILLFLLHFMIHGIIWETLKMLIKHIWRKIRNKKCEPDCKFDNEKSHGS